MRSFIVGTGAYAPEKVLTNADLEKMVETSDAWIVERTGIRERRIAAAEEDTRDMAREGGDPRARDGGPRPEELDAIIVGTITPDMPMPSCAAVRAGQARRQEGVRLRRLAPRARARSTRCRSRTSTSRPAR